MTLYAAALRRLGLSQAEAAAYHGVRLDTVKSWSAGRNRVPAGAWAELRRLYNQQVIAIDAALQLIEENQPAVLTMTPGPRAAEWPSEGAWMAVWAEIALEVDLPVDE